MAPPKRRSCRNCIKAKRRCDLAIPKCQRCSKRGLACDHRGLDLGVSDVGAGRGRRVNEERRHASSSGLVEEMEEDDPPLNERVEEDSHDQDHAPPPEPVANHNSSDPCPNATLENTLSCFSWNWITENDKAMRCTSQSLWLQTWTNAQDWTLDMQLPSPMNLETLSEWPSSSSDVEEITNNNKTPPAITHGDTTEDIYYQRGKFASLQLKKYPEMFHKSGQTPFIHWNLYSEHTPQVIQDVLSACALYSGKNVHNERLVYRDITRKAWDLASRPMLLGRENRGELLASTQALLLYQIIRLFDGDIRQRADAEAHEAILKTWTDHLHTNIQPLPSIANDTTATTSPTDTLTPSSWKEWIFQETCRRTILISYMLSGVYSFLKFGSDNVPCKVNDFSFTAQAALWNAPSEYRWKEGWKETKHFSITVGEWDVVMGGAVPNDLDELGVMVMASLKGTEITRQWLGGEHLERWGL